MMVARKRERFPLPRTSGRCRFGQGTFAGTSGNDEDAPIRGLSSSGAETPIQASSDRAAGLRSGRSSPRATGSGRVKA
jgi:hypothetical protein